MTANMYALAVLFLFVARGLNLVVQRNNPCKTLLSPLHAATCTNDANFPKKSGIYVLKLDSDRYYVGKSNDIESRVSHHFQSGASAWTRLHKPIERLEPINQNFGDVESLERAETLDRMWIHGIENVRGWQFTTRDLKEFDYEMIFRQLCERKDLCRQCGRQDHMADTCKHDTLAGWVGQEKLKFRERQLRLKNLPANSSTTATPFAVEQQQQKGKTKQKQKQKNKGNIKQLSANCSSDDSATTNQLPSMVVKSANTATEVAVPTASTPPTSKSTLNQRTSEVAIPTSTNSSGKTIYTSASTSTGSLHSIPAPVSVREPIKQKQKQKQKKPQRQQQLEQLEQELAVEQPLSAATPKASEPTRIPVTSADQQKQSVDQRSRNDISNTTARRSAAASVTSSEKIRRTVLVAFLLNIRYDIKLVRLHSTSYAYTNWLQ
jgi:hypothetical protein